MKQFDKYRMVDGVTPLAARYFNKVWQDIDLRLASLEEVKIAWQSAVDEVVKFGLVRIDELINEPLQAVLALSSQAERTSSNLEQLRQLAESRTAALAALIATLQADTTAQIQSFAAGLQNATAQSLQEWKDSQTAQLDAWMQTFEQELQAATDLLRNGNRKNLCPDVDSWDERATWQVSGDYKHWGLALTSSAEASTAGTILGPKIKVVAGDNYCISADSLLMATAGSVFVQLCFYDAGGTLLLTSGKKALAAGHDFSDAKERRDAYAVAAVAPATAAYMRPVLGWTDVAGLIAIGLRNVKVERGPLPVTPYSQEAQVERLSNHQGSLTLNTSQNIDRDALFGNATHVFVELLGAGQGGDALVGEWGSSSISASAGGAYICGLFKVSDLAKIEPLIIGAGGAGGDALRQRTNTTGSGNTLADAGKAGGNTSFRHLLAMGGGNSAAGTYADAIPGTSKSTINGGPPAGSDGLGHSLRFGPGGKLADFTVKKGDANPPAPPPGGVIASTPNAPGAAGPAARYWVESGMLLDSLPVGSNMRAVGGTGRPGWAVLTWW